MQAFKMWAFRKQFTIILAMALIVNLFYFFISMTAFAEIGCVEQVKAFLAIEHGGNTNAEILGWNIDNTNTWGNSYLTMEGDELCIKTLDLSNPDGDKTLYGELDLSGCTSITALKCEKNKLSRINLTGCTSLRYLYCNDNELTALDLSGCSSLQYINCFNNRLTELGLSDCTALYYLACYTNQLTELDVSNCQMKTILTHNNILSNVEQLKTLPTYVFTFTDNGSNYNVIKGNFGELATIKLVGNGYVVGETNMTGWVFSYIPEPGYEFMRLENTQYMSQYVMSATAVFEALAITKFSIGGTDGVIDDAAGAISITVPYGTGLTNVLPDITYVGAMIKPDTAQDFTSPVTYTIYTTGGTTRQYTVTATVKPVDTKDISINPDYSVYYIQSDGRTVGFNVVKKTAGSAPVSIYFAKYKASGKLASFAASSENCMQNETTPIVASIPAGSERYKILLWVDGTIIPLIDPVTKDGGK